MRGFRKFNTETIIRQARRTGSRWNRILAWSRGRADGKLELYGPADFGPAFEGNCQWLKNQQQRAGAIQNHGERKVQEWTRVLQHDKERHTRDLEGVEEKIRVLLRHSEGVHTRLPTTSHRAKIVFFTLMFLFEFFFSAVALITSGLVSVGFEIAIAIVAAGVLVWLSDIVGNHLRQLPLSPSADRADRIRHYSVIVFCCIGLAMILAGVNFLRSMTNETGPVETTRQLIQWALFAIGVGLVLTGIFRSGEHEYSGPRYGLAARERERNKALRGIAFCEATMNRLSDFPAHLQKLLESNVQKVFSIYTDQYRRQSLARAQMVRRA